MPRRPTQHGAAEEDVREALAQACHRPSMVPHRPAATSVPGLYSENDTGCASRATAPTAMRTHARPTRPAPIARERNRGPTPAKNRTPARSTVVRT